MPHTKGPLTRERVGQISFLLIKLITDEIRNGARSLEDAAAAISVAPNELAGHMEMVAVRVDSYIPHNNDDCPFCVIGTVKFEDHVKIATWPNEAWKNLYKCTVCQADFERECT